MYRSITSEFSGGVATVTLARPERRNAFSAELMREMIACAQEGRCQEITGELTQGCLDYICKAKQNRAEELEEELKAYEEARLAPTAKIVRTNREFPPDFINIKVEELVGDKPFDDLDKYITQDELRALSENYKKIAGFALSDVARPAGN